MDGGGAGGRGGRALTPAPHIRLIALADAPALARLHADNRAFLAPFEPARPADPAVEANMHRSIETILLAHEQGTVSPHVIVDGERVVGRITLSEIVRGPFRSGSLGYWLGESDTGRGLATAAVGELLAVAFGPLGLHRVQASTLLDNAASQRVLRRNGFTPIGVAPDYLEIAGRWQDHLLFQALAPAG